MVLNKLDILSKMAYFAKCKKNAITHILEFLIPLNDEQSIMMNVFYNAYFTYWLGLVDYLIKDISFIKQKDIENLVGSEDNYYYLRNLRNAVIHRAEDLANKGTVINNTNIITPFSPVDVMDQSGKKKYQPFYKNLMQIVIKCEEINEICLNLIKQYNLTDYSDLTREEFMDRYNRDPYIPSYVKTDEMLEQSWQHYYSIKDDMKKENVKKILSYFETLNLFPDVMKK